MQIKLGDHMEKDMDPTSQMTHWTMTSIYSGRKTKSHNNLLI